MAEAHQVRQTRNHQVKDGTLLLNMYQTAVHRGERKFAPVERVEQPETKFWTRIVPLKRNLDHTSLFSLDRYVKEFIQIISFLERSSFKLKWWNIELTLKCKLSAM